MSNSNGKTLSRPSSTVVILQSTSENEIRKKSQKKKNPPRISFHSVITGLDPVFTMVWSTPESAPFRKAVHLSEKRFRYPKMRT